MQRRRREEKKKEQEGTNKKNHKKSGSTDGFDIPEFPDGIRQPNQRKRYLQPVVDSTAIDILLNEEGSISKKDRLRGNTS